MAKTVDRHIRIPAEQWRRIQAAAQERDISANQLLVELAIQALDQRRWPSTETEIRVARASLFAAQAIARDMKAAGREQDIEDILDHVSSIVPDNPSETN